MTKPTLVPIAAVLTGLLLVEFHGRSSDGLRAQSRNDSVGRNNPNAVDATRVNFQPGVGTNRFSSRRSLSQRSQLQKAVKALRAAKDDAAKSKAKANVTKLLGTVFDADLKSREMQIADIEARVKELKSILDKRRTARDRVIDLQIKVLLNEADGLGFPVQGHRRGFGDFSNSMFGGGVSGFPTRAR